MIKAVKVKVWDFRGGLAALHPVIALASAEKLIGVNVFVAIPNDCVCYLEDCSLQSPPPPHPLPVFIPCGRDKQKAGIYIFCWKGVSKMGGGWASPLTREGVNWISTANWCLIKELVPIISRPVNRDAINHARRRWKRRLARWAVKASIKAPPRLRILEWVYLTKPNLTASKSALAKQWIYFFSSKVIEIRSSNAPVSNRLSPFKWMEMRLIGSSLPTKKETIKCLKAEKKLCTWRRSRRSHLR